jgi:colicin import membrane protein
MTADSSKGFVFSALLHGAVVVAMFLVAYIAKQQEPDMVKVFELVAGEGDNYSATEAPALGTPGGLKMTVPAPPVPEPVRPEPAKPEPAPIAPAPVSASPPPKAKTEVKPAPKEEPVPNFAKQMKSEIRKGENKAKREIAKERAAEEKKRIAEEKKLAEEKKKMSKAEFDAKYKVASATPSKAPANAKIQKLDAEGIAKGVLGGSTKNTKGGAGGKALTATEGTLAERYLEMLKQKLLEEVESRSALMPDGLRADTEFYLTSDGRIIRAKITKSSRNEAFDAAVLEALAAIKMPARPKGVEDFFQVPFVTSPKDRR